MKIEIELNEGQYLMDEISKELARYRLEILKCQAREKGLKAGADELLLVIQSLSPQLPTSPEGKG